MGKLDVKKIIHDYNERVKRMNERYQLTVGSINAIYEESKSDCYELIKNSFLQVMSKGTAQPFLKRRRKPIR